MSDKILLLVPCYNEEKRIDLASFRSLPPHIHVLFADDGSSDGTRTLIQNFSDQKQFHLYSAPLNSGKANVLFKAYQHATSTSLAHKYDWIGFWDADLATPLIAVDQMLFYLNYFKGQEVHSIWGSRNSRLGSHIRRSMLRHYLGRIFVTITSNVLNVKAYDSQCGAKLFRPEAAALAFAKPFISRWIFDVEILLRLKSHTVIEFPLFQWTDVPGSKVKIFREAFRVLGDLYKIRKTYLKN